MSINPKEVINYIFSYPSVHRNVWIALILILFLYSVYLAFVFQLNVKFKVLDNKNGQTLGQPIKIKFTGTEKHTERNYETSSGYFTGRFPVDEYSIGLDDPSRRYRLPQNQATKFILKGDVLEQTIRVTVLKKYKNLRDTNTDRIADSGSSVKQIKHAEMVLRTIIEMKKGDEFKPLTGLTVGNFAVVEKFEGRTEHPEITDLKIIPSSAMHIVFVLDTSGSMGKHVNEFNAFIDQVRASIGQNKASTSEQSGGFKRIWACADCRNTDEDGTQKHVVLSQDANWIPFDAPLDKSNEPIKQANTVNTPLYSALLLASDSLKNQTGGQNIIICLSDGGNNIGEMDYQTVIRKAFQNQTPIYSIIYPSKVLKAQENTHRLQEISIESGAGGKNSGWFSYQDQEHLKRVLATINGKFAEAYELSWKPTATKPGTAVKVEISIEYEAANKIPPLTVTKSYVLENMQDQHAR